MAGKANKSKQPIAVFLQKIDGGYKVWTGILDDWKDFTDVFRKSVQ